MSVYRWRPYDGAQLSLTAIEGGRIVCGARGAGCNAEELRERPCVAVAGVFDGLHLGHQELVRAAVQDAREKGVACVAVSFDPDPAEVIAPDESPLRLLSSADRAAGLIELGVDAVLLLDFTCALAKSSPEDFVCRVLMGHITPVSVHVGENFRFGHEGAGTPQTLRLMGERLGFGLCVHELCRSHGKTVSATRIRRLLFASKLDEANELLGRCHYVRGRVAHGRGEGTSFGFPTANVRCDVGDCLPAEGVYACYAIFDGRAWPAATNVGAPRSFTDEVMPAFMESNLIGFEGDLYDRDMTVVFVRWLRAPRTFGSLEELEGVVLDNIAWVREHLGTGEVRLEDTIREV